MKRYPKYPRLTPLRAIDFLTRLERAGSNPTTFLLDEVRRALDAHVKAALVAKRRRR